MAPDTPQQGSGNDAPWRQQGRPHDWTNGRRCRPAIVGTKQDLNGGISSGPVDMNIKVWNVTPSCEPHQIKAAIETEGVYVKGDVVILSKPEWRTKSFKVCIPVKDKDKILSPDAWPARVRVGIFYTERKPRNPQ